MYEQAEPVRSPFSGPDSRQTSGAPQPRPVPQSGSRERVRHGNGASDKQREDQDTSSHTYENAEEVKRHATSADRAYPGGASARRGVCSFLRARRSCVAAGIAVLLSLVAVGLAPLTFSNKQEISQLSTTVDALKRDQDGMSTTVDALKRDQDGMSTTVDALKRDLNNERSRTATLEQRLHEIVNSKTLGKFPAPCPEGYTKWRGICYKFFYTRKTFDQAAAACRADGGTLAMPRDAETNAFLDSLHNSVSDSGNFWIGLHDQREEGKFEWMDWSALGSYNSWGKRQPNNDRGRREQDCVTYSVNPSHKDKWNDHYCDLRLYFICQTAPGDRRNSHHCCTALRISAVKLTSTT
ncbi:PREDICTED: CD209 antigen-like [Branchiostoma belcheri]|uniref:CD209 antigen-like n=1 Tax=Branchiostoma belcheri TaxID=7741 RepID=A0A6P4Y094_BRABE|nr:PREDICTED: CD209 antigen-like [Branchiostoma belcheri]